MKAQNNKTGYYLVWIFWPMISVYLAIKNIRSSWAKDISWLFIIFFGFTITIVGESDAERYKEGFLKLYNSEVIFEDFFINIFDNYTDIVEPTISYFISRFTNDTRLLLAAYAFVFGFFFTRNIWYLINKTEGNIKPFSLLLLITFTLVMPFWTISGFRYNTALHIFLYGLLPFFYEKKKSKILFILLSPLCHFSFSIAVVIFLIYLILGNRTTVYFYFFLVSFFLAELDLDVVRENFNFLPEIFSKRVNDYTSEEYVETIEKYGSTKKEGINWYVIYYTKSLNAFLLLFSILVFYKNKKDLSENKTINNLFSFSLLFFGISNIISSVPSVGRFFSLAEMISLSFFYFFFQNNTKLYNSYLDYFHWSRYLLFFFCIVAFRDGLSYISLLTVATNPLVAYFVKLDSNPSIIELIKSLY
jgi:hypothetical protein